MQTLEIETHVSKATVYTDRALVTRQHQQQFEPGRYLVKLANLPDKLVEESFRISAFGSAIARIVDVKLKDEFFDKIPHQKLETLNQELVKINDEQAIIDKKLETLLHQKEFITSIKVFSAESISRDLQHTRPDIEDWSKMVNFLGNNLSEVNMEMISLNKRKTELKQQAAKIQAQTHELSPAKSHKRKCGQLELEVIQPGALTIEVCYITHNASWHPVYDARIHSENKTVELHYYGMVSQQTAEDWQNIEIQLSTAKAHIGGNLPKLYEWILEDIPVEPVRSKSKVMPNALLGSAGALAGFDRMMKGAEEKAEEVQAVVSPTQAGTSVVFKTMGRNNIPGDGAVTKVKIVQRDFPARFKYFAVPKLSLYAYLTAEITNNSDYPLLIGAINIFLDENYVGNSRMPALITPDEKFDLSLGIDESIKINHKLLKRQSNEKGIFSKDRTMEYSYLISIKNHRKTEEEITVWDQLPVPVSEKIKVNVKRIDPTENPEKDIRKLPPGTVEWKMKLKAQEEKDMNLSFVIQYPGEMEVLGL